MKAVHVIACAAEPATRVRALVDIGHSRGWDMHVIAAPDALVYLDVDDLEASTLYAIRSQFRKPTEPRPGRADGLLVAPATFSTICKVAAGIVDTYALDVIADAIAIGTPTVFLPHVSSAQARRVPFRRGVDQLRGEGARVLLGNDGFEYSDEHQVGLYDPMFPWENAAKELADAIRTNAIVPNYPPNLPSE